MSISGSSSKKTQNTSQNSQTDPWAETIPALNTTIGQVEQNLGNTGVTANQMAAITDLEEKAGQGNTFAGDIKNLATDAFGAKSQSGTVSDAYNNLQSQLADTASGTYLDYTKNPQMMAMLEQASSDAFNKINAQFAGAGRDLSGANQMAAAKGVNEAQLPILMDYYNNERTRQNDAAKTLYNAGVETGKTVQGLDESTLNTRSAGVDLANSALAADKYGSEQILNLEQYLKDIPVNDLAQIANILYPAASLGNQSQGSSTSKTSGSSVGGSLGL